ncbi:MAG: DegV family protein [Lachnospiraceae bacterium]|nr:DegV family protein [Lachnospiraceae bacterium]
MAIKIIADSTCDIGKKLAAEYDITLIPLNVIMGDKTYRDGVNITPKDIFAWAAEAKSTPKTATPDMGLVMDILKPYKDAGDEVICFCISEAFSGTAQTVRLAAQEIEFDRIHVINSMNLSTGIALQILRAADLVKEGKSAEEIVAIIEAEREKVCSSFCIDTLTYLHRGGRCSGVAALLGAALMLKPMIAVKDGKMGVEKKYRGKIAKVLKDYAKDLEPRLRMARKDRIFITHTTDDAIVQEIYNYVKSLDLFENIYIAEAGSVISSHCGPGTLGLLFCLE